jgi:hypothetical protein
VADFGQTVAQAYATQGEAIQLGQGVHNGAVVHEAIVQVPLKMLNRHGLIAGATGTGKTRTLQILAEQLSAAGVSVFLADVKGDISGIADPGDPSSAAGKRAADLGIPLTPTGFPAEYLSLGGIGPGVPVRATVSDFGPQLLGKVLESNAAPPATGGAAPAPTTQPEARHHEAATAVAGGAAVLGAMLNSPAGRRAEREVIRGVFGMLKKSLR